MRKAIRKEDKLKAEAGPGNLPAGRSPLLPPCPEEWP